MKKIKYLIYLLLATFIFSSCSTYNAPTKYQGRNLYKFNKKKKTQYAGKVRKHKYVSIKKRGSYWHRAVTDGSRREIRQRWWSENAGGGQSYK